MRPLSAKIPRIRSRYDAKRRHIPTLTRISPFP